MARILCVEDEPDLAALIAHTLTRAGHEVELAADGGAAVAAARRRPPDLAVVDIILPDILGFGVCELLRTPPRTAPVPVIFLTALDDRTTRRAAREAGAAAYLTKPFRPRDLVHAVATQLAAARRVA